MQHNTAPRRGHDGSKVSRSAMLVHCLILVVSRGLDGDSEMLFDVDIDVEVVV